MPPLAVANALAYFIQVAMVIGACAGVPRLFRVHAPGVQYLFWRSLLLLTLLLPFVEPWLHVDATAVVLVGNYSRAGAAAPVAAAAPAFAVSGVAVWIATIVIVAGMLVRLGLLAIGLVRLRRLRAEAAGHPCAEFSDLQEWIGTRATICWSTDEKAPSSRLNFFSQS